MKTTIEKKSSALLSLLAGVSLAFIVPLTSCSTGTDSGDVNVERSSAKSSDPQAHNRTEPDTAQERQVGIEHYEQTYGGAKEPESNVIEAPGGADQPQEQTRTQRQGNQ
jgi:type IV secretory pathway TrbL component